MCGEVVQVWDEEGVVCCALRFLGGNGRMEMGLLVFVIKRYGIAARMNE